MSPFVRMGDIIITIMWPTHCKISNKPGAAIIYSLLHRISHYMWLEKSWKQQTTLSVICNSISGVVVSVLASNAVDRGFELRLGQTKEYQINICCFSAKHGTLRRKSKDWLAQNQGNVSEWGVVFSRGLLFQWVRTIKLQLSVMV